MPSSRAAKVAPPGPRRAEVLGAVSLAMDLGLGQPTEHVLRTSLVATALADRLDLDAEQQGVTYYAGLISWIGCVADSPELATWFGDDIAYRYDSHLVDSQSPRMLALMATHVGRDRPKLERAKRAAQFWMGPKSHVLDVILSHCSSATMLSNGMSLDERVGDVVGSRFERWDGKGLPVGLAGTALPVEIRIVQLADLVVGYAGRHGQDGLTGFVRDRAGHQLDPDIVATFLDNAELLLAQTAVDDVWPAAMAAAPDHNDWLDADELDALLLAIGDFVDLRSPSRLGHSRRVAELASAAGQVYGLPDEVVSDLRRAGYVHDLGRMSVPTCTWDKPADLTTTERERVRLCPYFTHRMVRRVAGLEAVAELAGGHGERLDGSGHPHGVDGQGLSIPQRILAAADVLAALCEPRAHRPAMNLEQAVLVAQQEVEASRLDSGAVEAVLVAAGGLSPGRAAPRPAGLTARELEVLSLLARGQPTRSIAESLGIADKTVRNHVQRIYAKIGVSNRTGASMFALRHGLVSLVTGDD